MYAGAVQQAHALQPRNLDQIHVHLVDDLEPDSPTKNHGRNDRSLQRHRFGTCPVFMGMSQSLESRTGVDKPVTVIKNYTVPANEAEYFVEVYRENARIMSTQPGFLRSRLHRALADTSEARFVHIADWGSGTALDKATTNPEWLASLRRMFDDPGLHINSEPAAYRIVVELHPS